MPKQDDNQNLEAEVWNAISAFEQILEAIPNDRASLEALWNAYEQLGDYTRAKDYLLRMGNVLMEEGDFAAAVEILDKVKQYAADDESARALASKIESFVGGGTSFDLSIPDTGTAASKAPSTASVHAVRSVFNMADELSFAWTLKEAKQLTEEEYSNVVQDLSEMSAVESATTVSVLHVLESRAFKNLEKIIGYVSKDTATPIVSLTSFDFKAEDASLLPLDVIIGRGVFVFETIGKAILVAIMNPYDKTLRKDIEGLTGRKCYFFVCLPSEFDKSVANLMQKLKGAAEPPKK